MNNRLCETTIPSTSQIIKFAEKAHFADCYQANLFQCNTSSQAYRAIFGHAPSWVAKLMGLRNAIAGPLRLKRHSKTEMLEAKQSILKLPYLPGKRAGLFLVETVEPNEIILGENDKHLDFRISVFIHIIDGQRVVAVSTVVIINSWLGHAYMAIVKPFHRLIAKQFIVAAISSGRL
jgi:Protein of unknown function (DUF2867)